MLIAQKTPATLIGQAVQAGIRSGHTAEEYVRPSEPATISAEGSAANFPFVLTDLLVTGGYRLVKCALIASRVASQPISQHHDYGRLGVGPASLLPA